MALDHWVGTALALSMALTLALLVVFVLRQAIRRRFGAGLAYGLWMLIPIALAAALLPNPQPGFELIQVDRSIAPEVGSAPIGPVQLPGISIWSWLLVFYVLGAFVSAALMLVQELRFRASLGPLQPCENGCWRAARPMTSPALVGLFKPRIVIPPDFEQRWNERQRVLVLAHELVHARRGDPWANAFAALLCAMFWFHPLVWLALRRFRADQEMACDAKVLNEYPHWSRSYAEALLVPVSERLTPACRWSSQITFKERIKMLNRSQGQRGHQVTGLIVVGLMAVSLAGLVWSAGSVESTAQDKRYFTVTSQVRVSDDDRLYEHRYQVAGRPGKQFGMDSEIGNHGLYSQAFSFEELEDGLIDLRMTLSLAGETVSTPRLIFRLDHADAAAIETVDRSGTNFRLEVLATSTPPDSGLLTLN